LKLGNAYEEAQKFGLAVAQWRMTLDLEPDHPQRMNLLNQIDKYRNETPVKVVPKSETNKEKSTEKK
jgi:cytochrome c-type biogenesis protein CcmH/NrfG